MKSHAHFSSLEIACSATQNQAKSIAESGENPSATTGWSADEEQTVVDAMERSPTGSAFKDHAALREAMLQVQPLLPHRDLEELLDCAEHVRRSGHNFVGV